MTMFDHHKTTEPANEGLYDKLRRDWVEHFQTLALQDERATEAAAAAETESLTLSTSRLQMGWALHKKGGSVRFSQKVRQYLVRKFNIGQDTGRKEDPAQVAKDMRTASMIDRDRMFDRSEWLSKCQIQGFFSRLSASIKQGNQTQTQTLQSGNGVTEQDEDEDVEEEYACDEHEEIMAETREDVLAKIGLTDPIMYDIYDLCLFSREGKLQTFKVKMLRAMCTHFDLSFRTRDNKADLVSKMEEMISGCSCIQICC